jgi:6,7-dimethyl-8-ribityllumazine synthase
MARDPEHGERSVPARVPARAGASVGLVVSRFHAELVGAMRDSALRELHDAGVRPEHVHVVPVPGAFELPIVARRLAESGAVDCVICLGLVLRGETEHDRWVAEGAVHGLVRASQDTGVPMHLGVLTCATLAQARARALPPELGGQEDKGREVARAALETLAALDGIARLARAAEARP